MTVHNKVIQRAYDTYSWITTLRGPKACLFIEEEFGKGALRLKRVIRNTNTLHPEGGSLLCDFQLKLFKLLIILKKCIPY